MKIRTLCFFLAAATACAQSWLAQTSHTTASLRGVSAVNARVVWASGAGGTYLRTTDAGATWTRATVPGAQALDFRGVQAVDANTAYLLSAGEGGKSRIYKTKDAGAHWTFEFTNPDAHGFWDAIAFWNTRHGIVLGDPVNGRFSIFSTRDGGAAWHREPGPAALPNEGAFAASNTCLRVYGKHDVWFVTTRVFHSQDGGVHWSISSVPLRADASSAGIFSIGFSDPLHGIVVGGDYARDKDARRNVALTSDGGRHWTEPAGAHPKGFRSAVAYAADEKIWIATGTSGSDFSKDNGQSWTSFDSGAFNALALISSRAGWAVGPSGRVAKFVTASASGTSKYDSRR